MSKKSNAGYHYTGCGLDGVYLLNLPIAQDRAGDATITIPNINLLHALLRHEVASKVGGLTHREIRFLRTELGLTQAQLAKLLHKDTQTVGRWERGETPIDGASETLLRMVALEEDEGGLPSVREVALKPTQTPEDEVYRIDASNPEEYRRAAA